MTTQRVYLDMQPPVDHRSHSAITTYSDCGERFRLERIAGVPQRPYLAAAGGSAFHAAAEELEFGGPVDDVVDRWPELFEAAVAKAELRAQNSRTVFRASGRATKDKPRKEDYAYWRDELGPGMIRGHCAWISDRPYSVATGLPPDQYGRTVGVEYAVDYTIQDVRIIGYIDLVLIDEFGNVGVCDIKTSTRVPVTLQLPIYKLGLLSRGVSAAWGNYYMARKGVVEGGKSLIGWTAERIERWVVNMDRAERLGFYQPNPGDRCHNFCSVADHCAFKP